MMLAHQNKSFEDLENEILSSLVVIKPIEYSSMSEGKVTRYANSLPNNIPNGKGIGVTNVPFVNDAYASGWIPSEVLNTRNNLTFFLFSSFFRNLFQ